MQRPTPMTRHAPETPADHASGSPPSRLEEWFSARFADDAPRTFGSGWISGVVSVVAGVVGVGAVLVLKYPAWLAWDGIRDFYPVPLMRSLIATIIALALLLGCLSVVLRRRKTLGLTGLGLGALATLLGGSGAAGSVDGATFNVGLDWFLLNLVLLALVFVPLERAFPRDPDQRVFRIGWVTDGEHFLVSHLAVQALTWLSLAPATLAASTLDDWLPRAWMSALPLWLQVPIVMCIADLTQYWVHRAFHEVRWLWPFHAVHHSSRALDWLAGSRLHVVDVLVTRALVMVPLLALGFSEAALHVWIVVIAVHAVFNHVNLRFRLRFVEDLLVTPRFHHWHHAVSPVDRNYAVHFPWLDRLFGTHWLPEDAWPDRLGIAGDPVPEGWLRQLVHPLRKD
jgi:sterol desaturase/sphingolipid hydroxylase (fatty acid hydroxylase superfamily)